MQYFRALLFLALTSLVGCANTVNRFTLAYTAPGGQSVSGGWEISRLPNPAGFTKNALKNGT